MVQDWYWIICLPVSCRNEYPMLDLKMTSGTVLKDCIVTFPNKGWFMQLTDCEGTEYLNNLLHDALITK